MLEIFLMGSTYKQQPRTLDSYDSHLHRILWNLSIWRLLAAFGKPSPSHQYKAILSINVWASFFISFLWPKRGAHSCQPQPGMVFYYRISFRITHRGFVHSPFTHRSLTVPGKWDTVPYGTNVGNREYDLHVHTHTYTYIYTHYTQNGHLSWSSGGRCAIPLEPYQDLVMR